jgi:creatinine amidohydrolase
LVGNNTMASAKDCPVVPYYVHANIGETSCMLAARPDLVNMEEAINEEDYSTFFEYRTEQYSKSGIVGRETMKATAEFGEKIFAAVVDNLSDMIGAAFREDTPRPKRSNKYS